MSKNAENRVMGFDSKEKRIGKTRKRTRKLKRAQPRMAERITRKLKRAQPRMAERITRKLKRAQPRMAERITVQGIVPPKSGSWHTF